MTTEPAPPPEPDAAPDGQRTFRSGGPWTPSEDDELVAGLRAGLTVEALAEAHGRTAGAVAGRLARMAPDPDDDETVPKARARRIEWLRERLAADPGYDWRAPLEAALGPWQRPWTDAEDALVRDAWDHRRPLAGLAAALGVEEHFAVRRLLQLGLATGIVDATDRLGCTPGSVTAARRALALDAARTHVLVLVLAADGDIHHVSVHARQADADTARDRAVAALRDTGRRIEIAWTVAERQVDDGQPAGARPRTGRILVQGDPG